MTFDIDIVDFGHDASFVLGGYMTKIPATVTYSRVISSKTVQIDLMVAAPNDLEVKTIDIMNAYTKVLVREKIWTMFGPESGKTIKKNGLSSLCI